MKISRASGPYCFDEVLKDQQRMYIFEDNPHRTAGQYNYLIAGNSWYQLKYQPFDGVLCRESDKSGRTSCIRGLPNAYPLCTVGNMYGRFWADTDLEKFSRLIESDIYDIVDAAPRFTEVIVPWQGIFKTEESGITKSRCPKIYECLREYTEYLWWLLRMI